MAKFRKERIDEEVSRAITEIVRNVKDPRVSSNFITITSCDVTRDLKYAKIYYSLIDSSPENIKSTNQGLVSATGYIRMQLAQMLNLRQTPILTFIYDDSMIRGSKINEILKEINISEPKETNNEEEPQ